MIIRPYLVAFAACSGLLGFAPSVFASTNVTVDSTIHFRLINRKSHIEAVWKRYPLPKKFSSYFIVRSEPGGPTAPEAGDIVATTTNRYSTNATDHPSHNGKYYYRLCVNKRDGDIVCSRAAKVVLTTVSARVAPPLPVTVPVVEVSSTEPVVHVLPAVTGEMELTLSSTAVGTRLTWTPAQSLLGSLTKYILVRSFSNSAPSYPTDGYLAKVSVGASQSFVDTVYVDPSMVHSPRWYRVCAVVSSDSVQCGTVATITP